MWNLPYRRGRALLFGDMAKQLRIYTVKPGEMEAFSHEWGEHILPMRLQRGFRVLGPWVIDETNQFIWILEHQLRADEAGVACVGSHLPSLRATSKLKSKKDVGSLGGSEGFQCPEPLLVNELVDVESGR